GTKFLSLGSIMCMLLYPIVLDRITQLLWGHPNEYQLFAVSMAILVIAKHHDNISRLLRGEERKFSFKKSKKPTAEPVAEADKEEKEDAQA
ncbi:MAG: glycerol-3-phosphate acyltransferase, partial [Clostridia bacterium]|nr:glycerol-3-phosphate acyltransferase [Clostridia bacterium]